MVLQIKDNVDRLKVFQVLNDYSQKQMGELLGISASTYCRLINRKYTATPKVQQRIHKLINGY
ncbi:transcriptional regulator with XRE-family HTH domain [Neobacillus niacini]|uniref:helix-turn-helix domain-containing protein n=1 Tax=Neobacillus niacini TaxID=86668 RepID=UPI00278B02FA|nr:helix-turn-helix transcriptional regulator [Neobacillus niacini]MDQ1003983.1 transcriptional regulator with XRE-family HTH domain [Neobacillus niacini]